MNVPKASIEILCLVTLFGEAYANIDAKEYFCGKKLVRTLTELCSIYNYPTFGHKRFRRQIVEECCRSQCSRRYLVQYYCSEAHSSVTKLLAAKPEVPTMAVHNNKDTRNYQSDMSTRADEKISLNRVKKVSRMPSARNVIANPVPPPNIGRVESSQKPFYVWRLFRAH